MLKIDLLTSISLLCLITGQCCITSCNITDKYDSDLKTCFYLDEDEICLNIAKEYELVRHNKFYKNEEDYIDLLYKVNNDSISLIIRRVYNHYRVPPFNGISYLGMEGFNVGFIDFWDDIKSSQVVRRYYSIPTITDNYYLQTDLMTVNFNIFCFYKKVFYVNVDYLYMVNVKYNSISKLDDDNAKLILNNFYPVTINGKELYKQEILFMD